MKKQCDRKCVGVIIRNKEKTLLIARKNYPVAVACVAGHLDGDSPLDAAVKETGEEVNIALDPKLFLGRISSLKLPNPCKRDGGVEHEWFVFEVQVPYVVKPKAGSDAKEARWVTPNELAALVETTKRIARKHEVSIPDLARSTPAIVGDPEWIENPGLEPVWVVLFQYLKQRAL